jgi:hypothetical protein
MVITLLPTAALATDTLGSSDSGGTISGSDSIGDKVTANGKPYYDVSAACTQAVDGSTIELLGDNVLSSSATVPEGKTLTIDLKGYTISGATIVNNGILTIKDSSTDNTGAISVTDAIAIENHGTLTVTGGTITATGNPGIKSFDGTVNISGGTIEGYRGVWAEGGTQVTVTGGTLKSAETKGYGVIVTGSGTTLTMSAGAATGTLYGARVEDGATATITGGTFTGTTAVSKNAKGSIAVSGGTFSTDPSAYLASGYKTTSGDSGYTISELQDGDAAASIDGNKYATLTAAANAAAEGDVILLEKDITESITTYSNKKFTLDLNDKTLTGVQTLNGDITVKDSGSKGKITNAGHTVLVDGSFTLESGTIESTGKNNNAIRARYNSTAGSSVTIKGGTVTANGFAIAVFKNTTTVVEGGTLISTANAVIGGNGTDDGTCEDYTITIKGGELKSTGTELSTGDVACGIYHPNTGKVTMTAGKITTTGGVGVLVRAGEFEMTGGTITVSGTTTTGMVGDAKEIVGCYGVEVDSTANYPKVASAKVTISGGTIDAANGTGAVFDDNDTKVLSITGGTYSNDPTGYYDTATYGAKDNGDGTYTVLPLATCTAPTANTLTYDGTEQALVTAGTAEGGTLVYSTTEDGTFSKDIPTGTNAGSYTVYYKVQGDATHADSAVVGHNDVTIAVKSVAMPAADTTTFTYDGTAKTYTVAESDDYTVTGNKATNAGTTDVTIALIDKTNTQWSDGSTGDVTYTFTIGQATAKIEMDESYILNEDDTCDPNTLNIRVTSDDTPIEGAQITVMYYSDDACEQNGTDTAPTKAGTYYVKATYTGDTNHAEAKPVTAKITIVGTEEEAVAVDPVVNYDENLSDDAKAAVKTSVESVKITDTDKLTGAVPDVDPDPDEVKAAIEELNSGDAAVTVYTEAYLDIQAKEYTVTDTTKALTLDITPMSKVVVSTAAEAADISTSETAPVGDPKKLTVEGPVDITITLPDGFATETDTVYVTHVKNEGEEDEVAYLYDSTITATDDGLVLSFTNPHGFSSFTFSTAAPAASIAREEGTHAYASLYAAILDVTKDETITLHGDDNVPVTVGRAISFSIRGGNAQITAGDNYVLETTVNDEDGTTTYTVTAKPAATGGTSSGTSSYAISVANAEGGKVSASPAKASKGTKVTLTVTAEDGKELDALTVTDASGKTLETTKNADGTYTFTMPASKVTVTATFKDAETQEPEPAEEDCPAEKFTDVDTSKWYHEAVDYVLTKGVMEGNSDGTFTPNGTLTRAQLAQILYNAAGKPEATAENPFTDVPENQWYAKAVIWAAQAGVVEGYGDGTFGPNDKISRQDLAVMLWRYAGEPTATKTSLDFTDAAQASDYATAALLWASETGIVQGDNGKLSPKGSATRAEAATMVMRYLELG